MSRSRRIVLVIAGCLLFFAVLVPPWLGQQYPNAGRSGVGYGLLFSPPSIIALDGRVIIVGSVVDLSRLGLEALLIILATGVAWFALPQKPSRN